MTAPTKKTSHAPANCWNEFAHQSFPLVFCSWRCNLTVTESWANFELRLERSSAVKQTLRIAFMAQ